MSEPEAREAREEPEESLELKSRAQAAFGRGLYAEALELYSRALEALEVKSGGLAAVLQNNRSACLKVATCFATLASLSLLSQNLDRPLDALEACDACLALEPGYAKARARRAALHRALYQVRALGHAPR